MPSFQIAAKIKASSTGGMRLTATVSASNSAGNFFCYPDTAGPYSVSLPTPGVNAGAAANLVDSAGDVTIANLISAGGADVVIPGSTTYIISNPIAVPSGKTVRAATGSTVVCKARSSYTGHIFTMTFANSASVKNITLDGNWTQRSAMEGTSGSCGVQIQGGSACSVENCEFLNMPSFGVWVYNSNNLGVRYNYFNETYHPIRIDGNNLSDCGEVVGNNFYNTSAFRSYQGLEVINSLALQIKHNTFEGVGKLTPTVHGGEGTWGNSIYIYASSNYVIENNTCRSAYWSSCVCGQSSTNVTVKNNYFSHGVFGGSTGGLNSFWFEQAGADTIRISKNYFNGGFLVGDTGGNNCIIEDNVIDTYDVGIDVSFACTNACIQRNRLNCLAGTDNGIFLWEKHPAPISVSVLNNVFNNFTTAIFTNNSGGAGTAFGLTITGNTFSACTTTISKPAALTYDASCVIQS